MVGEDLRRYVRFCHHSPDLIDVGSYDVDHRCAILRREINEQRFNLFATDGNLIENIELTVCP